MYQDNEIRNQASAALRKAALNDKAKTYLLNNPILFKLLLKAARRYIGGENLEEALIARKNLHSEGTYTSLEFMGENVTSEEAAIQATYEFLKIIGILKKENKQDRISLDLSHLGLGLDSKLGRDNFRMLAQASENTSIELFISAEGLDRTDDVLETYFQFSKEYSHVHITLQAYLHRTCYDLKSVLEESHGKVRLTKGAFDGPKELLLSRGPELNDRYIELLQTIITANRYCSIATHDSELLDRLLSILENNSISQSMYEFEMLYGIGDRQFNKLKEKGYL